MEALVGQPAVGVLATVEAYLGRPASRAELNAARRAAHRLGSLVEVVHVEGVAANEGRLVLVRPGVHLDPAALKRAAVGQPPRPQTQGRGGTTTARSALRAAQRAAEAARQVDEDRIGVDQADSLSVELDDAIEALVRLSRQLRRRASSDTWMKPTDRLWQQRWEGILVSYSHSGDWPKPSSTDPEVKSQARWVASQRRQHRHQRLSPERAAMMRAAGLRLTAYQSGPAGDEQAGDEQPGDNKPGVEEAGDGQAGVEPA